jgi:hypothetical protein
VKDGHIAKIPDHITFEQAATLGVAITSVGQSLYMKLGLPLPGQPLKEKTFILINGGSSATGSLAIQFAKLCILPTLPVPPEALLIIEKDPALQCSPQPPPPTSPS